MRGVRGAIVLTLVAAIRADAAGTLAEEVGQLSAAVAVRSESLAGTTDRDGVKERAKLGPAAAVLGSYAGRDDRADLTVVAKALAFVAASGTEDAQIAAEAADVLDALSAVVSLRRVEVARVAGNLQTDAFRLRVQARIDAADARFDAATALTLADPPGAARSLRAASVLYDRVRDSAVKLRFREIDRLSRDLRPDAIEAATFRGPGGVFRDGIANWTGAPVVVSDFLFDVRRYVNGEFAGRSRGTFSARTPGLGAAGGDPPLTLADGGSLRCNLWKFKSQVPSHSSVRVRGRAVWVTSIGVFETDVVDSFRTRPPRGER